MSLENVIPGLAQMRDRESLNRSLAFAGLMPSLCGEEVAAFTPGHRLRLQLIRNAFVCSAAEPLAGDVFQFLWLVSAHYERRMGFGRAWYQWRLRRRVRRMNVPSAEREIRGYIAASLQDSPEIRGDATTSNLGDYVHWFAFEAGFWMDIHGGFTLEQYARTPYLVLQQLRRVWQCNHPEVTYHRDGTHTAHEPMFINDSDHMVGQWHRRHAAAVAEIIKAQREKRN